MEYDVILIGGLPQDIGRPIGPYRLRTSIEKAGYSALVIDSALYLNRKELMDLLSLSVTEQTKIIGISTVWFKKSTIGIALLGGQQVDQDDWYLPDFFEQMRTKWPWVKFVAGGTTLGPMRNIKFDYVVSGYADNSIIVLLEDIINNTQNAKFSPYKLYANVKALDSDSLYPVQNIDEIETIWKPTDGWLSHQPMPMEVSRGCIFKCSFCNHPFLGKKNYEYIRSKESLADEMRRNYEMFGTTRYLFIDDTLNDSIEKLDRLLRAIELSKIPNFECVAYIRAEMLVTKPEMIPMLGQLGLKGGFVGLESFGAKARMAVGKGMDIERVLEALASAQAQTDVKWQTGFIVGLPGDTPDMLWDSFQRIKKDKILLAWNPTPLNISGSSLFMQHPAKYGYTFEDGDSKRWISDVGMTAKQAAELTIELDKDGIGHQYVAGWYVSPHWFHNATKEQMELPLGNFRYKGMGIRSAKQRASHLLNLLKSNKDNT